MNTLVKILFSVIISSFIIACGGSGDNPPSNPQPILKVAPTAVVADDFSADENTSVVLDGSSSLDSDGSITSYVWAQTSGSYNVDITNTNQSIASFTAPDVNEDTSLVFELTVTDNDGQKSTASVKIDIIHENQAPIAISPTNVSAIGNNTITLNGSDSNDPDGSIVSYSWIQISGSPSVTISTPNQSNATFTAPNINTELVFELTVTDNYGATDADLLTVNIQEDTPQPPEPTNNAPTVDAGQNQSVEEQSSVNLFATYSDSDGYVVSGGWMQTGGTPVTIQNANEANATFTAPALLDNASSIQLTFTATVTDNENDSASDTVKITVNAGENANVPPTISINSPSNNGEFYEDDNITFSAVANDTEDGDLSSLITWTSSIDGNLGSGSNINSTLSIGNHSIEASIIDSGNITSTATVELIVLNGGCSVEPGQLSYTNYTISWDTIQDEDLTGFDVYYGTSENLDKSNALGSFYVDGNVTSSLFAPGDYNLTTCERTYIAVASVGSRPESTLSDIQSIVVE